MANPNVAFGFTPSPLERCRPYDQDASDSTAIFFGDIVDMESDGNISPAAAGSIQILGSAMDHSAASTAAVVLVADSPTQEFFAQDDGDSTTLAQTNIGTNCDHIAGTGQASLLVSGHEIDASSTTTATAGFRLLQAVKNPDYAIGVNQVWRVHVNEHHLYSQVGI
jgi:hypothetical protein